MKLSVINFQMDQVWPGRRDGSQSGDLLHGRAWSRWAKKSLHRYPHNQPIGPGTREDIDVFVGLTLSRGSRWSCTQVHHQLQLVGEVVVTNSVLCLASQVRAVKHEILGEQRAVTHQTHLVQWTWNVLSIRDYPGASDECDPCSSHPSYKNQPSLWRRIHKDGLSWCEKWVRHVVAIHRMRWLPWRE